MELKAGWLPSIVRSFASHHMVDHISVFTNSLPVKRAFSVAKLDGAYTSVRPFGVDCSSSEKPNGQSAEMFVIIDMDRNQSRHGMVECLNEGIWLFIGEHFLVGLEHHLNLDSDVFTLNNALEVKEHYRIPVSLYSLFYN